MIQLAFSLLTACTPTPNVPVPPDSDPGAQVTTAADLDTFYAAHGGRDALPAHHVVALEALLYAQDDLAAGDRDAARARVDAVFAEMPLSTGIWREDVPWNGTNIGDPVAYYGLRMLDQILRLDAQPVSETLTLTAVIAPCAQVTRPTLPDRVPETVDLDIDPRILADDAQVLRESTDLFRAWVQAITGGLQVELVVHELDGCTTVDFTDDGAVIVSYPDAAGMVAAVPDDVAQGTDMWWVVAPSGVPGDGSGFDRHFITGGMGGVGMGLPLFLSDDAWFTRKPEHLGSGAYSVVERRAYQPQWFQHEFMHHLFRTWPEFGLEASDHQWFDRSTWPDDFEGIYEPDYYIEAVDKRLLTASPSLVQGLTALELTGMGDLPLDALVGDYLREPELNDWHVVHVTLDDGALTWHNAAGVSWSLVVQDGALWTGDDCPYGASELGVEVQDDAILGLWFGGERYGRTD
jgi:hypothetical protein